MSLLLKKFTNAFSMPSKHRCSSGELQRVVKFLLPKRLMVMNDYEREIPGTGTFWLTN